MRGKSNFGVAQLSLPFFTSHPTLTHHPNESSPKRLVGVIHLATPLRSGVPCLQCHATRAFDFSEARHQLLAQPFSSHSMNMHTVAALLTLSYYHSRPSHELTAWQNLGSLDIIASRLSPLFLAATQQLVLTCHK